ncbi:sporulation stage III protein AG [Tissierella pigra]|uniref:Sporulation stage III protein AG n=2 Tax=Tissierella pigra TaxID=2607614 RepID=A0A6N7XTT5_9FIRM|nr:sporulation stage III protein AG [Tissierella pigra]MST99894.1 sporulation stage III protein AG [Tissierella pigra]
MKEILNKIKEYLEKNNNKKFINNLFIILLVSVIFLIVTNNFLRPKEEGIENPKENTKEVYKYESEEDYSSYLEKKLTNILTKLNGVGKVSVMVTLENSIEKVAASNTTKTTEETIENDSEGGTREIHREDITTQVMTRGSDGSLLVVKEIKPTVQGVIVVAEGADDPILKEMLYEAVKTVLGIKGNKVQVYSSK